MDNNSHSCKDCGNIFSGKYCNTCGEKIYNEKNKKLSHFFGELFHFSTHLDGKFFTTLKTVFTAPGKLSLDYCNGIRNKYFKPLSLFLVIIILYLLFPIAKGLNMKFNTYISQEYNYEWFAKPIVKNKISKTGISIDELAMKYDAKSQTFAKPFLLLTLPLTGLLLFFLFFKKREYFFDHFVFAIELSSVIFAIMFLIFPLLKLICTAIYPASEIIFKDGGLLNYIIFGILIIMIIFAIKRFYGQSWFWTIAKSLVFLLMFTILIIDILYNFLLFITVNLFI
jgi:hypothetical protein